LASKQLTVHNATINTAAVEVKTLTISGKQVTLAVFRQLREEQLIAEDGTLNGQPWGYVNYHPDKCDQPGHRHYVWQQGDELLRSRVDTKPAFDDQSAKEHLFFPKEADRYVTFQVREWLLGDCAGEPPLATHPTKGGYVAQKDLGKIFGIPVVGTCLDSALKAERAAGHLRSARYSLASLLRRTGDGGVFADEVAEYQETYNAWMARLDADLASWGTAAGQLTEAVTAAAKAEDWRRQRQRAVRVELAELPQLFIAV
jgi:hypothetical protein